MNPRIALEGVGAALLILFFFYMPLLVFSNLALYHHGLPVTNLIGGILVDMLGVAILTAGFLAAVQYLPAISQRILIALFAGLMLWRIVDIAIIEMQIDLRIINCWGVVRRQSCIAILLLSGILAFFLPRITQPVVRAVRLVLAAVAFSALWVIPQLLHLSLVRQPLPSAASNQPSTFTSSGTSQRIVLILFDELSYNQTFDHPAPGIKNPNFDRLRHESVSFSNLKPSGFYTDHIIPSLFLGQRINQIRSTTDGELWYNDESQHRWLAYDPNATLFALARRNGWSSGVDGWSIPYCRIFAPTLNVCSWEPGILPTEAYGASEEKSVLTNAFVMPSAYFAMLAHHRTASEGVHLKNYRNVMARAHALIENSQVRFIFLHLNVPHPPGIYDRKRRMLRSGGTYLDNLALTDETLGALLQEIYATPAASQTTLIVTSDHSWRIPLWRRTEFWSDEEERASGGRFDDRPVLLIHFPDQKVGDDVSVALPELLEHDMIADMLCGKINNPQDLAAFLAKRGH